MREDLRRLVLRLLCCVTAAAAGALAVPAAAQSGLPLPGQKGAATSAPQGTDETLYSVDEIRKAGVAARSRLEAIETAGAAADVPPGTPAIDVADRLTLLRQLVSIYEKQLNTLVRTDKARERRSLTIRDNESWSGFEQPPPHSALMVDALRDELDAANAALAQAESSRALFQRLDGNFSSKVKAAQAAARLAGEAADRVRGTPSFVALEWQRELATLRAEVDSATQALLQLSLRGAHAEGDEANARRDLARRKLVAAGAQVTVPREDFDKVVAEIEIRRLAAERELARATTHAAAAQVALAAAERQLAIERASPARAGDAGAHARLAELERASLAEREVAATADQKVLLLREHLLQLQGERAVWDARVAAISLQDPIRARAAHDRLTDSLAGLRATKEYVEQQLSAVVGRVRDEEARQRSALQDDNAIDKRLLAALREREADLRTALERGRPLERLVEHFRADFEGRRDITIAERARDAWAGAWLAGRQLWNFEMFTIDDALETADGRRLAVSRSITVGKTFGALLIVILGYLFASFVVRWIERHVVSRGDATPQGAALVRKWILFVLAAVLAIVAMLSASIPLTAFAFLGGALAIAAGFGLQTLLKNLVSGVMLLVERPMRLGDLVEVDGIRGRITEIGIRASTIRSVDGIESMIPNSRFIEGNMTNWTYTSPKTRQSLEIGVAYGSPLRDVSDILNGVVERHGLVLKDPKPQVYLDEYADSAINFSLTYWVEMADGVDTRRVKSDLLHMIDRAFEDAGISIPFPQRDVRLTSTEPVPVAIVAPAAVSRAAA